LELLPKPAVKSFLHGEDPIASSTLANSFFLVNRNNSPPPPDISPFLRLNEPLPLQSPRSQEKEAQATEIERLKNTMFLLQKEKTQLYNMIANTDKENEMLRKSILVFRNELQKQARDFERATIAPQDSTQTLILLNERIELLLHELGTQQELAEKYKRLYEEKSVDFDEQVKLVAHLQSQWQSLKDSARRRRANTEGSAGDLEKLVSPFSFGNVDQNT